MNLIHLLKLAGAVFCAGSLICTAAVWLMCHYAPDCPDPDGESL